MKTLVNVVQVIAVGCAFAFVVLLFFNEPEDVDDNGPSGGGGEAAQVDGAAVYASRCASCHGSDGGGGRGPQLSDGRVVERFPDVEDQIRVVSDGRGGMPAFGDRLSADEIRAVVDYTRTL